MRKQPLVAAVANSRYTNWPNESVEAEPYSVVRVSLKVTPDDLQCRVRHLANISDQAEIFGAI